MHGAIAERSLARRQIALMAFACGLAVANIYVAQPLLDAIASSFGIDPGAAGIVITLTQLGYGAGLLLLVPLGDVMNPRRLIVAHLAGSSLAVVAVALASSLFLLLIAITIVGLLAVVVQTIVAFAASQASEIDRGAVVGAVTSGVVTGILLSRALAGVIAQVAGWRAVYSASAVALAATAWLAWRTLPEQRRDHAAKPTYKRLLVSVVKLYRSEELLRRRGVLALLTFASFSTLWTSLVLPLSAAPIGLSHAGVGAFGLVGAAGAAAAARAGRLADRGLGVRTTGVALALLSLAWAPIALLQISLWPLIAGLILLDVAVQAVHVTSQTQLYAQSPHARSRMAGAYMFCYSIGSAAGAIASTAAYRAGGWGAVCALGAGISLTAFGLWALSEAPRAKRGRMQLCAAASRVSSTPVAGRSDSAVGRSLVVEASQQILGDQHDATRDRPTLDHAEIEQVTGDRCPELAGKVVGLFGPIEAVAQRSRRAQ
jgi:predicted MFS family arabinose efflux permease